MHYAKRMALSSNKTDHKILNLYKIRKAHERGIHLGFENPGAVKAEIAKKIGFGRQMTTFFNRLAGSSKTHHSPESSSRKPRTAQIAMLSSSSFKSCSSMEKSSEEQ